MPEQDDYSENTEDYDNYSDVERSRGALDDMSDISSVFSFSREDLINAQNLRSSPYRLKALKLISGINGSMELKQAYAAWVQAYFTEEVILANNTPPKSKLFGQSSDPLAVMIANADLALAKCKIASSHYDRNQLWYATLPDQLFSVFRSYISRSVGPERERIITGRTVAASEVTQKTQVIPVASEPSKKRKWF